MPNDFPPGIDANTEESKALWYRGFHDWFNLFATYGSILLFMRLNKARFAGTAVYKDLEAMETEYRKPATQRNRALLFPESIDKATVHWQEGLLRIIEQARKPTPKFHGVLDKVFARTGLSCSAEDKVICWMFFGCWILQFRNHKLLGVGTNGVWLVQATKGNWSAPTSNVIVGKGERSEDWFLVEGKP